MLQCNLWKGYRTYEECGQWNKISREEVEVEESKFSQCPDKIADSGPWWIQDFMREGFVKL